MPGYRLRPLPPNLAAPLKQALRNSQDYFTGVKGYSVSHHGQFIAILGLYGISAKGRKSATPERLLEGFMLGAAPNATPRERTIGSIQVLKVSGVHGDPLDIYAWVAGGTLAFVDGIHRAAAQTFVVAYVKALNASGATT